MSYSKEINDRINQTLAAAGLPVMLTQEERDEVTAMAEAIDSSHGTPVARLERQPVLQAVAAEMRRVFFSRDHAVEYDTRWCPQFDQSKPETMSRYYALVYGYDKLVPLSSLDQWRYVGEELVPTTDCLARLTADCHRQREHGDVTPDDPPVMQTAVVRGEIVCVFNICGLCYGSLGAIGFKDFPKYSGPIMWHDDGSREHFWADLFGDDDDDADDFLAD